MTLWELIEIRNRKSTLQILKLLISAEILRTFSFLDIKETEQWQMACSFPAVSVIFWNPQGL